MKDKGNAHRHEKKTAAFEKHVFDRGSSSVRKGRPWRFYDTERRYAIRYENHFRVTARTRALDGKHMRSVRRPIRASHVKDI